ncbi:vitamin k epoxide reductase family protein [Besnoitia besnoiti]|uniref:vitamin-K-epoxide reductase (warfarin-sensitive) n=1 Tax=Besnoitia besnoiti TaxID=94643 RepID=A0A2A9MP24_BESBE|nr:vitamin k epoxide reductase family protein [Besnoitia besnoiti]PFH38046.1 vitamin k epoxide reductase family protein [Besnoitia besnoiti]
MGAANLTTVVTASLGVALCLYAMRVEHLASIDSSYRPYCDISSHASCSRVLTSPQSRLLKYLGLATPGSRLDFPNTYLGLAFYTFMLTFPIGRRFCHVLYTLAAAGSMASSLYLAYVLYAILKDFCIVCVSSYVVRVVVASLSQLNTHK